jgi:hypothetical protein
VVVRSKFVWPPLVAALLWTGIGFSSFHKHRHDGTGQVYSSVGVIQLLIALSYIAMYLFSWWRIDDSGLTQYRLGDERTIPWNEITHVGPWQPNDRPNYKWVAVRYSRPAPLSDRGELIIQPKDRNTLIQTLRSHAPQAEFEFFPVEI